MAIEAINAREMSDTVLIVPGFHGSGPDHWQSWMERELTSGKRVGGIDWERPVLAEWAAAIGREMDACSGRIWLVAHSFGCLASAMAMAGRRERVAGAILVAPAEPERFTASGPRSGDEVPAGRHGAGVASILPVAKICDFGLLVASRNDPWMSFANARLWADRWALSLYDAGRAGHINVESGHGRWPLIFELLGAMRRAVGNRNVDGAVPPLGALRYA